LANKKKIAEFQTSRVSNGDKKLLEREAKNQNRKKNGNQKETQPLQQTWKKKKKGIVREKRIEDTENTPETTH